MSSVVTLEELRQKIALIEQGVSFRGRKGGDEVRPSSLSLEEEDSRKRRVSSSIDQGSLTQIKDDEFCFRDDMLDEDKAFQKIQRILVRREHSSREVSLKLKKAGYSDEVSQAAVDRAVSCGLIDDDRYFDVLVRSRLSQGKGKTGIVRELELNGAGFDRIEELLGFYVAEETEIDRAREALGRFIPRSKNKRHSAFNHLLRKGFSFDVASSVSKEMY